MTYMDAYGNQSGSGRPVRTASDVERELRQMEVARGGSVPDGIPIGQQPTKPCEHDFVFLRQRPIYADIPTPPGTCVPTIMSSCGSADVFYCRKCLEYREVQR